MEDGVAAAPEHWRARDCPHALQCLMLQCGSDRISLVCWSLIGCAGAREHYVAYGILRQQKKWLLFSCWFLCITSSPHVDARCPSPTLKPSGQNPLLVYTGEVKLYLDNSFL